MEWAPGYIGPRAEERGVVFILREDGRVERMCAQGIGHPVGHRRQWAAWMGVHGCSGGCAPWFAHVEGEADGTDH